LPIQIEVSEAGAVYRHGGYMAMLTFVCLIQASGLWYIITDIRNTLIRLETAMLTLMGGFCHPQLTMQLRHIALLELGPHLEQLLQQWMTVHGSSVSPGVEKALRLIMKAHEFFESRSADFAPSQGEEQRLSPGSLRKNKG
jgi:hypothetical protein